MSASFWLNYVIALLVVAFMLAGLYVIMRSLARGRILASADRRMVAVLESTMLSQHASLHVVKVGTRYLLVGGSNAQVNTLAELPPEEVDAWLVQQRNVLGIQRSSLVDALKLFRRKP